MDISKVIKAGLTSGGVSDINIYPSGRSHNESFILRIRRQFRQQIYDDHIPQHLIDWLDHWHTPLQDVQAVSTGTHLPRSYETTGATTSQQIDLTEDTSHTDRSGPTHLRGDINPPPLSGGSPHHPPIRGDTGPTLNPPLRRGRGQPLDPQGRHNGDIHTTRRHRRVEDNWDMRVDDPLCVALAPAALQM